jgi:hypothetical protein
VPGGHVAAIARHPRKRGGSAERISMNESCGHSAIMGYFRGVRPPVIVLSSVIETPSRIVSCGFALIIEPSAIEFMK